MSKVKRNGNIEILRFLFCILIIFHHFERKVFDGELFTAGYLGVEFFFIVTGIFLGKRLKSEKEKHHKEPFGTAAKEGAEFVWKRICNIYPYFFLASLIGFSALVFTGLCPLLDIPPFFGDFGFVQLLGLPSVSATGIIWYLSALFFALLLIYPFVRKFYDAFVYFFSLIFPPIMIGIMVKTTGNVGAILENVFGVFNIGILRAIAMISIGLVVNELTDRVKELPTNRLNRFVFTACELVLYSVLFFYLVFVTRGQYDYWAVVLMAFVLVITLSEKSFLYGKLDGKVTLFLGKASMILFMCHYFWVNHISLYTKYLPSVMQKGILTKIVLGFALTFATSAVVYFGGNLLRFLFRKVKTALTIPPKNSP